MESPACASHRNIRLSDDSKWRIGCPFMTCPSRRVAENGEPPFPKAVIALPLLCRPRLSFCRARAGGAQTPQGWYWAGAHMAAVALHARNPNQRKRLWVLGGACHRTGEPVGGTTTLAVSSADLDKFDNIGLYSHHPVPMRGAARDRHDPRGGMRWTRQRSARGLGGRAVSSMARVREPSSSRRRRRCAVRPGWRCTPPTPTLRAGPSRVVPMPVAGIKAMHRRRLRPEQTTPASADGDEPKRMNRRRGEHEASRKPTARGTPDGPALPLPRNREREKGGQRGDRGAYTRVLSTFAHGAADAARVRRSARPLLKEGEAFPAKLGRAAPREREVVSALRALFDM
jgi:hypothetical protein